MMTNSAPLPQFLLAHMSRMGHIHDQFLNIVYKFLIKNKDLFFIQIFLYHKTKNNVWTY